jgi:hypothetical protein
MAVIDFGGVEEEVVTRDEFPISKALEVLKDETIAVIGYGVQPVQGRLGSSCQRRLDSGRIFIRD